MNAIKRIIRRLRASAAWAVSDDAAAFETLADPWSS